MLDDLLYCNLEKHVFQHIKCNVLGKLFLRTYISTLQGGLLRKSIVLDNLTVVFGGCLWSSGSSGTGEIYMMQTKPGPVSICPFKVIKQRPGRVASYIHTI